LDDLSPRLENCRAKIVAAERDLNRHMKGSKSEPTLSLGGSGFRVVKKQQEYPWTRSPTLEPLYNDAFEKIYVDQPSQSHHSSLQESYVTEPAPEPRLGMSLTKLEGCDFDTDGDAEVSEEDLRAQLSTIESRLLDLDSHWQEVDRERHSFKVENAELSRNLEASRAREGELDTELRASQRSLEERVAEVQRLKTSVATLEGESATLRTQRDALKHREGVLDAQADSLHANLYASRNEVEKLKDSLAQKEQERAMIAELLREAEDGAKRRKADEELVAETQLRMRARETLTKASQDGRFEAAISQKRGKEVTDSKSQLDETAATNAFWDGFLEQETSAPPPNISAIPELLFVEEPSKTKSSSSSGSLVPAICRIELGSKQFSLQMLSPAGNPRNISLEHVESIDRPDNHTGVVDLDIRASAGAGAASNATKPQRLRLVALDEHGASALVAAINLPDRVVPGCTLGGSPLP
jgi:myosin heavy subunit